MSTNATSQPAASVLDDDAWDDLISFIEERRVIPIIGPELLMVDTDQGPRLLHDWLAEKLARRLNVDVTQLPQPYTLNDVVCWFLSARGRREEIRSDTIVGGDGASSRVARAAGWSPLETVPLVQAMVALPKDMQPDTARVWFVP